MFEVSNQDLTQVRIFLDVTGIFISNKKIETNVCFKYIKSTIIYPTIVRTQNHVKMYHLT